MSTRTRKPAGGPVQTCPPRWKHCRTLPASERPKTAPASSAWLRGYFCAVAALLRSEGAATSAVRELFRSGGDWRLADPDDIAMFEQHGLTAPDV